LTPPKWRKRYDAKGEIKRKILEPWWFGSARKKNGVS